MLNIAYFYDRVFEPFMTSRVINTVFSSVRYMALRGLLAGVGLGAIYGTALIFFFPISTIVGAVLGGIMGMLAGAGCGLLTGLVTAYFFYPLIDSLFYQRMMTSLNAIFGFVGTFVGFSLLFQADADMMLHSAGIPMIVIPALIAAGAAWRVSGGFATRYATEKHSKEKSRQETAYV